MHNDRYEVLADCLRHITLPSARAIAESDAPRPMSSRLPQWMQSAKRRDEVLRGLQRLRERLPSS